MSDSQPSRILVLGAYGLIGAHVARALAARGHDVVALGRDRATARRVLPDLPWVFHDLRRMTRPEVWGPLTQSVDFVVNCAGSLQASGADDLEAVHLHAIGALAAACERAGTGLVQISAVGAEPEAPLAFFRTKAEGDALVRAARTDWWIFRPGLVIAPTSYGGTTLIRTLAAVPFLQPIALPTAPVQTVSVDDVALAVARAVEGITPPGAEADLVSREVHPLVDIVAATRRWLGFKPAQFTVGLPMPLVALVGRVADLLGRLGWRSPLRTTAIRALAAGVVGRPEGTRRALGRDALSLEQTYRGFSARVEDRLFARVQLLVPLLLVALAASWIWKGATGLWAFPEITETLIARDMPEFTTRLVVAALSTLSIALGLSLFVRRLAVRTLVVMVFVAIFYGAAVSFMAPALWADPFGARANLLVIIAAALATRAMLDTR
jgi:uncharacterized protein YbjT (DUF2867 family)